MTVNFNKPIADPNLKDLLDAYKRDILLAVNCHAIATIQSFDSTKQTVQATINYTKTFLQRLPDGTYSPTKEIKYPILIDCPAVILGGGKGALTFPIETGDQALILFNDRDIDNWFAGATSGPVATPRLHSLSDGLALIGLNDISNYDPTRVVLRNGTDPAMVGVGETLIKISNAATSLGMILTNLNTTLSTLFAVLATPNTPTAYIAAVNAAAATAGTSITSIQTLVTELLE